VESIAGLSCGARLAQYASAIAGLRSPNGGIMTELHDSNDSRWILIPVSLLFNYSSNPQLRKQPYYNS
jgi:hypothetical protein